MAKKQTVKAKAADGSVTTFVLVAKDSAEAKALLERRAMSRGTAIGEWV